MNMEPGVEPRQSGSIEVTLTSSTLQSIDWQIVRVVCAESGAIDSTANAVNPAVDCGEFYCMHLFARRLLPRSWNAFLFDGGGFCRTQATASASSRNLGVNFRWAVVRE